MAGHVAQAGTECSAGIGKCGYTKGRALSVRCGKWIRVKQRTGSHVLIAILLGVAIRSNAETILFQEDYGHFKNDSELLRVVESRHPDFPRALRLRSVKGKDGKIRQGHWRLPLGNTDAVRQGETMEVRFWMKAVTESARYALLANDGNRKAITLIQNNGFFEVSKSTGWNWEKVARCSLNQWHKMLYRVHCQRGTYDVFVDDMDVAAVRDMPLRDSQALFVNGIYTLGSENAESETLLGPVTVSLTFPKEFPPESFNGPPYYLKSVGWTINASAPDAFTQSVPLSLSASTGHVKEAARLQLLRDQTNLYCLFRLDGRDMAKRNSGAGLNGGRIWTDDCFELFIQPDPTRDTYYHFAGNSSGARYGAKHQAGSRDDAWKGRWDSQIRKDKEGWTALITVPFAEFGVPAPENAVWGFDAGRENPYTRETLSWTVPERFGRLYLPALNDPRPVAQRIGSLMETFYDLPNQFGALSEKRRSELPFARPVLQEARLRLGEKLKALGQARAVAASFQEFAHIASDLKQLQDDEKLLQQNAAQLAALFEPGSESQRRAYAVCVESSMTKIMDSYCGNSKPSASLLLSGNEWGSFQVVLLSQVGKDFHGVKISVPPLKDLAGDALVNVRQQSFLVEPVRTAFAQKAVVHYPDVLKPGAEFRFGNRPHVALWFDFCLPPGTPAGTYRTQIRIEPEGREASLVPVTVEATGLTLPSRASLDTAFCFDRSWVGAFYGQNPSTENMRDYCDFILEHRLEPMNLWAGSDVDIGLDCLDYCAQRGKTMLFLPITNLAKNKARYQELIRKYHGTLRPVFFGHDEVLMQNSAEKLAAMKKDFALAKELFPDVPRLNTAPVDERLFGYVDIWCPLFSHFIAADSTERMRRGEKVWWYPTDYPLAPYANFNLDSPGIDPRIIPWMNWKLHLSGLLYWGLNREWLTNGPKESRQITPEFIGQRSLDWLTPDVLRKMIAGECRWPEVPWLPYFRSVFDGKSVSATNGGGNLFYPGPGWKPWPSMRLKNLRDGMQDYEYFVMLKNNVEALAAKDPQCSALPRARTALAVDDEVLGGETRYTKDPERLLAFRERLIGLVKETGLLLR